MSIISSIYNNQSRDINEILSQGHLSQSSKESKRKINLHSPVKQGGQTRGMTGLDEEHLKEKLGLQTQTRVAKGSLGKEGKRKQVGSRQLSSGLEIDFYN